MPHAAIPHAFAPESTRLAGLFLADLQSAHRALLGEMAIIDQLTHEPELDSLRLTAARWKISQASLRRRTLSARIRDYCRERGTADEIRRLAELEKADRALLRASAGHISSWSAQAIRGDWPGYCQGSRQIRGHMHQFIALEQRELYPLLEKAAGLANRGGNGASDGTRTRDLRRDRPAL